MEREKTGMRIDHLSKEELKILFGEVGDSFFDHIYGVTRSGMQDVGFKFMARLFINIGSFPELKIYDSIILF